MTNIESKFSREERENPITRATINEREENERHSKTLGDLLQAYQKAVDPACILREAWEYERKLYKDKNFQRLEFNS